MKRNANTLAALCWRNSAGEVHDIDILMLELARALVRVTIDDLDAEIQRWLKRITITLGYDRGTITQIDPVSGVASFTNSWAREPERVLSSSLDPHALVPWTLQQMLAGEIVVMSSPNNLPSQAAVDSESFYRHGTKSNLMVPITVGGVTVGAIALASLYAHRSASPQIVHRLRVVADILGSGLQRKQAVTEILHLRNELTYVSRFTMMGQLAASVAHELNQPLAAILNNAEAMLTILVSDRPDFEEVKAGLADIIEDDNRAREIIRRLRALFRRDELTRLEVDVAETLRDILRIVRSEALTRNIPLSLDAQQAIPPIFADRTQIQQAIINLILNAFDAVAGMDEGLREVRVAAMASGETEVRILVTDSGRGIAPHALPKIFDAFFTTKPHGMGMGLAIAKSIVEAHHGRLSALPNRGGGTTFEIRLPVSRLS